MFIDFWIEVNGKIDQRFWMPSTRRSKGFLRMGHGMSKIRPKAEVLAEARAKRQKIHVGALMVIVSIKGYEKSPSEWVINARIVFRGVMLCVTKPIMPLSLTI
jgi:hypothetical protein